MSSKLDHSLDEILASTRSSNRRGNKTGPVGGVRKRSQRVAAQKANVSVAPNALRNAPKAPAASSGKVTATASKIIVSNLPKDVTENMIKEYFASVVGPIRKATITYGPNGQSRGIATVEFQKAEHAALAAQKYNGVDVDKRPMKVELVIDPTAPASFADRVGTPRNVVTKAPNSKQPRADKPKPAVKANAIRGGRGGNKRGGARAGSGRGKPKTADELDQEMADYFGSAKSNAPAAPAATNGGDVGMEDTEL